MKKFVLAAFAVVLLVPAVAGARGEFSIDPIDPGVRPVRPVCGNGVLQNGETCDDGNATDGDGCSSACQTETPEQTCSALFTNKFDVLCCVDHLNAGEKPAACLPIHPPLPRPTPPETQPGPETVPSDPCASIEDPALKTCCEQHGGLTLETVQECIPDSDDPTEACHIVVNVTGDVNAPMNICCQYVNNANVIQDTEIVQECRNVFDGAETPAPADQPSVSQGAESSTAAFACSVTALDSEKVNGKLVALADNGVGASLKIDHIAPAGLTGAAFVELSQEDGPAVTVNGPAALPYGDHVGWTVQLGRPESMVGDFIPDASFLVTVRDASGSVLHQTSCGQTAALQAQGGSGGCSLGGGASARSGEVVMIGLASVLLATFRSRKRSPIC